jgi:hypothetical protein
MRVLFAGLTRCVVIVCGGRLYSDKEHLYRSLDSFHKRKSITLLVQGGAKGADKLALQWAISRNIPYRTYYAEWDKFGTNAGPIRNQKMLKESNPNYVIGFPGGVGTKHMLTLASNANVPVITY